MMSSSVNSSSVNGKDAKAVEGCALREQASSGGSGSASGAAIVPSTQAKPTPFKLDLDAKSDPDFMHFVTEDNKRRAIAEIMCHKVIDDEVFQRLAGDYSQWRVSLASGTRCSRVR